MGRMMRASFGDPFRSKLRARLASPRLAGGTTSEDHRARLPFRSFDPRLTTPFSLPASFASCVRRRVQPQVEDDRDEEPSTVTAPGAEARGGSSTQAPSTPAKAKPGRTTTGATLPKVVQSSSPRPADDRGEPTTPRFSPGGGPAPRRSVSEKTPGPVLAVTPKGAGVAHRQKKTMSGAAACGVLASACAAACLAACVAEATSEPRKTAETILAALDEAVPGLLGCVALLAVLRPTAALAMAATAVAAWGAVVADGRHGELGRGWWRETVGGAVPGFVRRAGVLDVVETAVFGDAPASRLRRGEF